MSTTTVNPLLGIRFQIPFDEIRAEHIEPAVHELLERSRANQKKLSESTGPRTYENTLIPLEDMTEELNYAMQVSGHLESVSTYPELRAAYNAVQPEVSEYYTGIVLDAVIWRAAQEFAATPEAAQLTGTRKRLLTKT